MACDFGVVPQSFNTISYRLVSHWGERSCGQTPPLKNVCKPPGQWQTYDITLFPAKFENGKKVADAHITVYQNGELIHDNTDIKGPTPGGEKESADPGPIRLQDHGHPVEFRNIWIVPLDDKATGAVK